MENFWTSKYFRIGTVIGVIAAFGVALLILRSVFVEILVTPSFLIAITGGVFGSFLLGFALDKRTELTPSIKSTLIGGALIFGAGVILGSAVNLFSGGSPLQPQFSFFDEFQDWFLKPVFSLCLIGMPASQITAFLYFWAYKSRVLKSTPLQ